MGGLGSGRRLRWDSKDTTDSYLRLDVRLLQRDGWLMPGRVLNWRWLRNGEVSSWIEIRTESGRIVLDYRHRRSGGEWTPMEYPVILEWTTCHYGGRRAWFRCPLQDCGRRVAILYGGAIFACRHCHQLAYESQHEAQHYRALRRAQSIRMKLGGSGAMDEPFPERPKGMHRRTYWRWIAKAEEADSRSFPPWLGTLCEKFSGLD